MTVSTTESRIGYNGNGATTAFAFPYRFLANADLVVTLVRADTTQVVQTLNTDYTVTGAGDDAGGTVTMVVPPATGQQLVIVRDVPLTQETDYISGDPFPAESHETALDKLTMISQRLNNLISRSIRLSDADLLVSSTILPSPIANATLVWNATGTAIVNGVGSGEFVGLSPYMEVVLGSVDATEARANLGALGTTGAESVAGVKTFSSSPVLPGNASTALQAVPKQQLDALLPAGAVAHFAMSSAPSGWLKADGSAVSRTTYAALFAAIGTTFGAGNGTTNFNIPDLRGEFIRGWDDARAVDTGRVFGSAQSDEIKLHGHPYRSGTASVSSPDGTGGFQRDGSNATNYSAYTGTPSATTGQQIGGAGGTETRPRNIALLACIKF